jgi:Tfp pilus assembly protein PilN
MPQQINLCTGLVETQRQRFTARTMLPALGVFVVLGSALCAAGVWSLDRSAAGYRQTNDTQSTEIKNLQAAITQSRANANPVDPALVQQLQERRAAVLQRENVLLEVQQGMFHAGAGHSDRLLLVARSIPAPAWVTSVKVEAGRFEVAGFTLEPGALNDWVARLAASPLMRNLKLSTVTVENTVASRLSVPVAVSATVPAAGGKPAAPRSVWSFSLVNVEPQPLAPGGKP